MATTYWRSVHGSGPYEAVIMRNANWVPSIPEADRARYGIYTSELEAVERAIKDNQRLARTIAAQVAALKVRRANLKTTTVTKIDGNNRGCDWAMADQNGLGYPHGIKARRRVTGAGEFYDGDYCIPHAKMAVEWSRDGVEILI